jgi:integrase
MASVFKRGRWVDADGRRCAKDAAGAKWVESRYYTVKLHLPGDRVKFIKGYTDKQASEQLGSKLERAKAQGTEGLEDPYKLHRKRPIVEHVADWTAELQQLGRDEIYFAQCAARMQRLIVECGWRLLTDVSADSFCKWRETANGNADHNRKDQATRTVRSLSPRCKNHYLATLMTFCRWCIKRHRMASNVIADVEKVDESNDVRRERRALTAAELLALLAVVPDHYRLGYQVLMGTGLRRGELLQLRWADVRLNAPHPFIQLRAATTKSKRADVLPLRADLADVLRDAKGDAAEGDRVVKVLPRIPTHREYLAAAGIAWLDDAGRRADLHALRHSYGTLLSKGGVSPREAMSLMRHTDLRLTMKVYTDPRIFDLAGAVEKLPLGFCTLPGSEVAKATGTHGALIGDAVGRTESATSQSGQTSTPSSAIGKARGRLVCNVTAGGEGHREQTTPSEGDGVVDSKRAGEGIRTLDVQLGKLAFYH